jgi:hypothetical protein
VEVSKRAILNSVLFRNNLVYVTHGEENIDTTEMGMVAAVDATGSGALSRRRDEMGHARVHAVIRLAGDG